MAFAFQQVTSNFSWFSLFRFLFLQGEDRWLSTLLLKQGYRIEYEAAADAETYAPEGFDEFFNQRRRWTPSSVANTLDLLADYKVLNRFYKFS